MRRVTRNTTLLVAILAGSVACRSQLVRVLTRTTGTWIGAPRG